MKKITLNTIALLITTIYAMGADVSPKQIKIPDEIKQEIRQESIKKWPDDYEMQAYEIKKQSEAYKELYAWAQNNSENDLAESIFRKAQKDWPGDYEMQWYKVQKQVESLKEVYGEW